MSKVTSFCEGSQINKTTKVRTSPEFPVGPHSSVTAETQTPYQTGLLAEAHALKSVCCTFARTNTAIALEERATLGHLSLFRHIEHRRLQANATRKYLCNHISKALEKSLRQLIAAEHSNDRSACLDKVS
jgi:hypothetical protein